VSFLYIFRRNVLTIVKVRCGKHHCQEYQIAEKKIVLSFESFETTICR